MLYIFCIIWLCSLNLSTGQEELPTDNSLTVNGCQESFYQQIFTIKLPARKNRELLDCKFFVKAFTADVCRMRVTFKKLVLASSSSCKDEYLKVGEKRVCGSILGTQKFPFPGNSSTIYYRGDGSYPLEIEVEQERCKVRGVSKRCDVFSSAYSTEIVSPNYPNPYPTPLTCLYTIQNSLLESCTLSIKFLDFNIPETIDCLKGRLLIDNEPYCGRKTGLVLHKNISEDFSFEFSEGSGQGYGGFRLLVDKSNCIATSKNVSTNKLSYYPIGSTPLQLCCGRTFSTPHIILTSPGFLQLAAPSEINCVYQITRTSPVFCRLRLTFQHFWVGQEDYYYGCINGFLEIDGRRFCGCQDGLSFVSYFTSEVKEIRLNMRTAKDAGFIIEVNQESCVAYNGRSLPAAETENPKNEVEVFETNSTTEKVTSRFLVPPGRSHCFQSGPIQWIEKVKGLVEAFSNSCPIRNTPIIPPFPQPPILPPPPLPPINPPPPIPPIIPPPVNPPNPILPIPINPIIPPSGFVPIIPPPIIINPIIPPPVSPIIPPPVPPIIPPPILPPNFPGQCQVFYSLQGYIQSPRYPSNYPPNLRCCYRIKQAPGYCRLRLIVLDFDIGWSPKCWKDYLLLDNRARYCARSLQSTISYIKFRRNYAYIDFRTDGLLAGRGFRAIYRQEPCPYFPYLPRSDTPETPFQPSENPWPTPLPPHSPITLKPPFELDVPAELKREEIQ